MTTSIAHQTTAQLGGPTSVLSRQRRDHVKLDQLLIALQTSTGEEQERILAQVCRLVFTHAFAEEAVLWPAVRRLLPDGDGLTTRVEEEHQEVNELVTRLEESRPGDRGRGELLDRVIEVLRQDVRDEEDELLPRLQVALGAKELQRLGWYWEIARRTAPTHAHPLVSRRPPGNVIAALPLSALDRTRDAVDRAARRTSGAWHERLRTLSGVLRDRAHKLERSRLMQRGETPRSRHRADPGHGRVAAS